MKELQAASLAARYAKLADEFDRLDNFEDRSEAQEARMGSIENKMFDIVAEADRLGVAQAFEHELTRLGH